MVMSNIHGFPTKNVHFGVFWGYHHLRKHPFRVYTLVVQFFLPIRFFPIKLSQCWFQTLGVNPLGPLNCSTDCQLCASVLCHVEDPRTAFWCISNRLHSRGGKRSVLVPLQLWVILRCSLYTYMLYIYIYIYVVFVLSIHIYIYIYIHILFSCL